MRVLCEGNWRKDDVHDGKTLTIQLDDIDCHDAVLIDRIEAQTAFHGMTVEVFTEELIKRTIRNFTAARTSNERP